MQHRWVKWAWHTRFCACCGIVEEVIGPMKHMGRNHFHERGFRRGEQKEAIRMPRPGCDNNFVPVRVDGFEIDIVRRGPSPAVPEAPPFRT